MPLEHALINREGIAADVVYSNGKYRLATDAETTVTVEEILGKDNYADAWFFVTNAGSAGDTVRIQIDQPAIIDVTSTLTSTEAGDTEKTATLIKNDLNNDSSFSAKFNAYQLQSIVFIRAKTIAEGGEFPNAGDLTITTTGSTTIAQESDHDKIIRRKKVTFLTPDKTDYRLGVLGIQGDVSSTIKADNPINESIRKILATKDLTVFYDSDVTTGQTWYVSSVSVADELAAEFNVWQGYERDRIELFNGDGSTKDFTTSYAIINDANYVTVKVNGVTKTLDSDYTVSVSDDGKTSTISFSQAPSSGTNNIEVTYDAVKRQSASFVQASSTYAHNFDVPLKLISGEFIVATVSNKAANAGIVSLNINGFYEVD